MTTELKRWKHRGRPLLIPVQHEPGVQRGFMEGKGKIKHPPSSEHQSRMNSPTSHWAVGRWAGGSIYAVAKEKGSRPTSERR